MALAELHNDVRALAGLPGIQGIALAMANESLARRSAETEWKDDLAAVFSEMAGEGAGWERGASPGSIPW